MWPYWLLLLIPACGVLSPGRLPKSQARIMWFLVGIVLAIMMGLRHDVGGDWEAYLEHFAWANTQTFQNALTKRSDPGYYGLSWVLGTVDGDVHALNFICAALLAWGTITFVRRQPFPWLALFAAVPYLIIVVGMGYTRQSAAIGCAMLGLIALGDGRRRQFAFWVLLGATFHKTAVLLLPIAALSATRNRTWTFVWIGIVAMISAWLFLYDYSGSLYENYVESEYRYASQGAGIRVAMNVVPAILYLRFKRRLATTEQERRLFMWLSVIGIICVPLLLLSPTAVDRMALYLIPIQLAVFGRLPILANGTQQRTSIVLGVVCYYTLVQVVWLNFAQTAFAWLPYQLYPLAS